MLDRHPNFHCDIAARIAELGRQPYSARAFLIRWQDRVLFGTDMAPDPAWYAVYYRFLETFDESFAYDVDGPPSQGRWPINGLGLPPEVMEKIYRANALRLIPWN
jgi:predicted TIM-barrel fold metal-dependent hydrolase